MACMVAAALAVASSSRPTEYLDEVTGATVAVVHQPLVFARERSGLGRDYVTLAAAAVDQSGRLSYVLVGYIWSVGYSLGPKDTRPAAAGVILQADERRVALELQNLSARDLGIGVPVHRPPVGPATPYIYVTDLATVQLLAESSHLSLYIPDQSGSANYLLFEDGRGALKEFLQFARARFN
jgi:hypothetical protein